MDSIFRGAEAVLTRDGDTVVKERVAKGYREPSLDRRLRSERVEQEARVLEKLDQAGVTVPALIDHDNFVLTMEWIDGEPLQTVLNDDISPMHAVARAVQAMHDRHVVHGDLTTTNILWTGEPVLIDFGLARFSDSEEDKAVDLHILHESLTAQLGDRGDEAFQRFTDAYGDTAVLERLDVVESRGRYQ